MFHVQLITLVKFIAKKIWGLLQKKMYIGFFARYQLLTLLLQKYIDFKIFQREGGNKSSYFRVKL